MPASEGWRAAHPGLDGVATWKDGRPAAKVTSTVPKAQCVYRPRKHHLAGTFYAGPMLSHISLWPTDVFACTNVHGGLALDAEG